MEFNIYIPTRGRTGWMNQITMRELHAQAKPLWEAGRIYLVCPEGEGWKHNYTTYGFAKDHVLECPLDGIGPTRQWILEKAPDRGVIMLDDDLYFSQRLPIDQIRPLPRTTDLEPMFEWISDQLDLGFVHGGISARQGNQHIEFPWTDCIRVNNAHFFDRDVFLHENLRFDALPVMEDFYVSMTLILRGYPNRVAYHYCWSQKGSGKVGGCSAYRTHELQAQAAYALHAAFPQFVTIKEKENKSGGSVFKGKRTDVQVYWRKAWDARDQNHPHPVMVPGDTELQLRRRVL